MHSSTILGTGSASVVIVPNAVEKLGKALELEPVATIKPSYMLYDLTNGLGSGVFTISDLIQVLAIISTLIFVVIAMNKSYLDWRERRNGWVDTVVKKPKK